MIFKVMRTYSETTPESREAGDTSDSGVLWHGTMTLTELKQQIRSEGFARPDGASWFEGFTDQDITTGVETTEALHVSLMQPLWIVEVSGEKHYFESTKDKQEFLCSLSTGDFHTAKISEVKPKRTKKPEKSQIDTSNVIYVDFRNRRKVS
jgi:hypothetical protein